MMPKDPKVIQMDQVSRRMRDSFIVPDRSFASVVFDLIAAEDAARWVLGDLISGKKAEFGTMETYRIAAKAMGSTDRWAFELAKVAETFPAPYRRAGVSWNLYRTCAQTDDPIAYLEDAVQHGRTAADVRRMVGRPHLKDLQFGAALTPQDEDAEVVDLDGGPY